MISFRADPMRRSHLARPSVHRNDHPPRLARRTHATYGRAIFWTLLGSLIILVSPAIATPVVELSGRIERDPSGSARIVAVASVAKGYHVNAHQPDEEFLIPTELTLSSPGVTFAQPQYPTPTAQHFAFAGEKAMLVYDGRFEISTVAQPAPSATGRASPALPGLRRRALSAADVGAGDAASRRRDRGRARRRRTDPVTRAARKRSERVAAVALARRREPARRRCW